MYIKSDTLLLGDVSKSFRRICLKFYYLDPAQVSSTPGLAWQAALKKTEVKLELLTDIDMLFMNEKRIRGGMFHAIHQYAKVNKNKESSYLKYWDLNNLYGWAMSQKLPVNNFECIEDTSPFTEYFIKSYNEESNEEYFLEVDVQ